MTSPLQPPFSFKYNKTKNDLRFHTVHGGNITLSNDRTTAERTTSIIWGGSVTFSSRPIRVGEEIYLRLSEILKAKGLTGVCFGFTTKDPSCMTHPVSIFEERMENFYIFRLSTDLCQKDNILHYFVNSSGEVHFSINGRIQDKFFTKIDVSRPLWAVIHVFGLCSKVQFVGPEALDGVRSTNQVVDGARRPDQVVDGARRPDQVEDGARRPDQVVDGARRPDEVVDGARRPDEVVDGARRPDEVVDGARRPDEVVDGARRPDEVVDGARRPDEVVDGARRTNHGQVEDGVRRTNQDPRFHTVHGGNIRLSNDRTTAERIDPQYLKECVTFSSRPIRVGEEIYLRLGDISKDTSYPFYKVSFGFTTKDPSSIAHSVPKSPLLTDNSWIMLLGINFCKKDNILHYYVNSSGELRFGVNGQIQDDILTEIDISRPLWAVIDFYGKCKKVQFVGPEALDGVRSINQLVDGVRRSLQVEDVVRRPDPVVNGARRPDQVVDRARQTRPDEDDLLVDQSDDDGLPAPGRKDRILHRTKGRNIHFTGRGVAVRCDGEYCQGYVFTGRPVRPGQTITVQILTIEESNQGSLAVGLTSCDPATLRPYELPDDAEFLQDRPEYWVVYPDAADGLGIDDELDVTLTRDGKMEISKNGSDPVAVLHVDHTLKLWAFFDIIGTTRGIRLSISEGVRRPNQVLDGVRRPNQVLDGVRRPNQGLDGVKNRVGMNVEEKAENLPSTSKNRPETTRTECTICIDNEINSVLFKCGHMCMCYDCAVQLWKNEGSSFGKCPICRAIIQEVIRTYNP